MSDKAPSEDKGLAPTQDVARAGSHPRFPAIGQLRDRNLVVYVAFFAILGFFAVALQGEGFLTVSNLLNILRQSAPVAVMAVGVTFALSAGEIDLSFGAVVALAALTGALVVNEVGPVSGVAAALGTGIVVGTLNGFISVKARIPSFLVTLGMLGIVNGLARRITNLQSVPVQEGTFASVFGSGQLGPVSTLHLWAVGAVFLGSLVYRQTRFGTHVLATGGNTAAAAHVGVNTRRIKIVVMIISSASASLAGLLYAGRLRSAQYTLGEADLLTVLAAVVIGGTSLFGGKGSIIGAALGALIMGMLNNGLILMGLDVSEQMIARGLLIIVAVGLSMREPAE